MLPNASNAFLNRSSDFLSSSKNALPFSYKVNSTCPSCPFLPLLLPSAPSSSSSSLTYGSNTKKPAVCGDDASGGTADVLASPVLSIGGNVVGNCASRAIVTFVVTGCWPSVFDLLSCVSPVFECEDGLLTSKTGVSLTIDT